MTRAFVYCEHQEGGMGWFTIQPGEKPDHYGWMHPDCEVQDRKLLAWMETATPGDWTEHRLGLCFCVNA